MNSVIVTVSAKLPDCNAEETIKLCESILVYKENYEIFKSLLSVDATYQHAYLCILIARYNSKAHDEKIIPLKEVLELAQLADYTNLFPSIVMMTAIIELETNSTGTIQLLTDKLSAFIECDTFSVDSDDSIGIKLSSLLRPLLDKGIQTKLNMDSLFKKIWLIAFLSSSSNIYNQVIEVIKLLLKFSAISYDTFITTVKSGLYINSRERLFVILCDLSDQIFQPTNKTAALNFIMTSEILNAIYIRSQIVSRKTESNCKRNFFLLRKIIDFIATSNETFTTELICYSPNEATEFESAWDSFFTIIENMHGDQSHLVIPSLGLLPKIEYLCKKWKALIIERGLQSDSKKVSYWCIRYLMDHDEVAALIRTETFSAAVNDTCLFDREVMDVIKFKQFIGKHPDIVNVDLVQKSLPFYYVSSALMQMLRQKISEENPLKTLTENEDLLSYALDMINLILQNLKFCINTGIRAAVMDECVSFIWTRELYDWIDKLRNIEWLDCDYKLSQKTIDYITWRKIRDSQLPTKLKLLFKFSSVEVPNRSAFEEQLDQIYLIFTNFDSVKCTEESKKETSTFISSILKREGNVTNFNGDDHEKLVKTILVVDEVKGCHWYLIRPEDIFEVIKSAKTSPCQKLFALDILSRRPIAKDDEQYHELFRTKDRVLQFIQSTHIDESYKSVSDVFDLISNIRQKTWLKDLIVTDQSIDDILDTCVELIDRGSIKALQYEMDYIVVQSKRSKLEEHIVEKILDTFFNRVMNEKRSKQFKTTVDRFLCMVDNFTTDSDIFRTVIDKYFKPLLELVPLKIQHKFLGKFGLALCEQEATDNFLNDLVDVLLFDQMKTREQTIENDFCYDVQDGLYVFRGMSFFYREHKLIAKLKPILIQRFYALSKKHPRYFADCQTHRTKLRICQYLVYLSHPKTCQTTDLINALFRENNQLNVTILLELLFALSPNDEFNNLLQPDFYTKLQPAGLQSLFVVLYYRCQRNKGDTNLLRRCVKLMLPYTMCSHFATRLYAQVLVQKLVTRLPEEFSQITQIIETLQALQPDKNLERVKNDFRWSIFDCERDNGLESITEEECKYIRDEVRESIFDGRDIFYEIPRITRMSTGFYQDFQRLREPSSLSHIPPISLTTKRADPAEIQTGTDNVQIKIIPRKLINFNFNGPDDFHSQDIDRKLHTQSELIIVASLLNKMPNLGGLARTCEIFNVKLYVMSSVKHLENTEFKNLSVTAEKWLNVAEVQPWQIGEYLCTMKEKGYVVVGAEQTANSATITEFKFPKKCILLLGEEREGIPANLISLLDHAVEIPQLGVTRSLNVHVCASLFVWEYVKQHQLGATGGILGETNC